MAGRSFHSDSIDNFLKLRVEKGRMMSFSATFSEITGAVLQSDLVTLQ